MNQWYVTKNGKEHGPGTDADLLRMGRQGFVTQKTRVRRAADGKWFRADQIRGMEFGPPPVPPEVPKKSVYLAMRKRRAMKLFDSKAFCYLLFLLVGMLCVLLVAIILVKYPGESAATTIDVIAAIATVALVFGAFTFGYLFPYFVARVRHHHNAEAIGILNLFLGWTFLGWVLALVWACTTSPQFRR